MKANFSVADKKQNMAPYSTKKLLIKAMLDLSDLEIHLPSFQTRCFKNDPIFSQLFLQSSPFTVHFLLLTEDKVSSTAKKAKQVTRSYFIFSFFHERF